MDSSSDEDFVSPRQSFQDCKRRKARSPKPGTSKSQPETLSKTEKERKKKAVQRGKHSGEKKIEERRKDRERKAADKLKKTKAELEEQKERNRRNNVLRRKRLSDEKQEEERKKARVGMVATRAKKTPDQKKSDRLSAKIGMTTLRENRSAEENLQHRELDRTRKASKKSQILPKSGLRSQEVLSGELVVLLLEETHDGIGRMDIKCQDCGALKFKMETQGFCCSKGKVLLPLFPRPPEEIARLWNGSDNKAKLLRKYSRELNNAVCLSSIKVQEKKFSGFNPSVIFQGQLMHRVGALLPPDGEPPRFAQLYVFELRGFQN